MSDVQGTGSVPPNPDSTRIHSQINRSTMKFLNALETYDMVHQSQEKEELKKIMDAQMSIIQANINALKERGFVEQQAKTSADYQTYLNSPTPEHFEQLERDISKIREFNNLPNE